MSGAVILCAFNVATVWGQPTPTSIEFASDSFFEFEDEAAGEVEVRRSGDLSMAVSVDYSAVAEIAEADIDFVPTSGTLEFAANEESATFSVNYIDDGLPEGSEPIALTLSNPTGGAVLGELASARLFVQDNERRGTLVDSSFDGAVSVNDFVSDLLLLPDGRVLAAGAFARPGTAITDRVLLFDQDGRRDREFDMENDVPDSGVFALARQDDGRIVLGGVFTGIGSDDFFRIARVLDDGLIDTTFSTGSGFEGSSPAVFDIAIQSDGKILAAGRFESYDGTARVGVARLNSNGSLDSAFVIPGGLLSNDPVFVAPFVSKIQLQPDGKILIGGHFTSVGGVSVRNIARLNENGSVDESFVPGSGPEGFAAFVDAVAIQEDGKILIGGDFSSVDGNEINGIARLNSDGSFDASFNPGAGVSGEDPGGGPNRPGLVSFIEVLEDGKILLAGDFEEIDDFGRRGIGRLNPNGSLDGTFGPYFGTTYRNDDGYEEYDWVSALAVQPDGNVITGAVFSGIGGSQPTRLSRLLSRNVLENTVEFDFPRQSLVENEGTLEVPVIRRGQSDSEFSVDYFVIGGSADEGDDFSIEGSRLTFAPLETVKMITVTVVDDSVSEENETIELGIRNASNGVGFGEPVSTVIEIIDPHKPGNLDFTFEPTFIPFTGNPLSLRPVTDIVIQPDRKILVSGYYLFLNGVERAGITRFNLTGTVDESFVPEAPENELIVEFMNMGLQPDGNIIGGFRRISQLMPNGGLNSLFSTSANFATVLAVLPDGQFVLSDNFQDPTTNSEVNEVVRFDERGTFDDGFIPASLNNVAIAMAVQQDGKILVGGEFTEVNNTAANRIARLNENGSRDRDFDIGLGIEGVNAPIVIELFVQPDGKILVGGEFSLVDGIPRDNLARLNADGSLDTSFDPGVGPNAWVESIAVQDDGKILIGGGFSEVDGLTRSGFARLNADGSVDESFAPTLTFTEGRSITAIEVQEDGQILIGGSFSEVNGFFRQGLARINGDSAASIIPPEPEPEPPVVDAPAPVLMASSGSAGTGFELSFAAVSGASYEIQASTNLIDWTTVETVTADGARVTFAVADPSSEADPVRFYRVQVGGAE